MDRFVGAAIVLALLAVALVFMGLSWQRRQRRDLALASSPEAIRSGGPSILSITGIYLTTTPREQPLERLAIPGLAFRARAVLQLDGQGLSIEPSGEAHTRIGKHEIAGVRLADATIDRSAGRNSLTAVDWRTPTGIEVSSFFRIPRTSDRNVFMHALNAIIGETDTTAPTKESTK